MLRYPSKKYWTVIKDGKESEVSDSFCLIEERENFRKQQGEARYLEACKNPNSKIAQLQDIKIPVLYEFAFNHFLEIWRYAESDFAGNKIITFRTLNDYVECMKVPLDIRHKKLILKMKDWAMEQIAEQTKKPEKKK